MSPSKPSGTAAWLTDGGGLTGSGSAARRGVELRTDDAAAAPWRALGADRTRRLAELHAPLAAAVLAPALTACRTRSVHRRRCEPPFRREIEGQAGRTRG